MDLTDEEEALYIEYAANSVLKHDKNYIDRMQTVDLETELVTETEDTTQTEDQQTGTEVSVSGGDGAAETESVTYTSMNDVFSIAGIDIQPAGYEVTGSYPSDGQEIGMSMVAVKGCKLLIMKFQVTNTGGEDAALDFGSIGASYKGIINENVKTNVQTTALLDALNTYNGVLAAGSSQQMVLVFQINENDANNISSVELNITNGDRQGTIKIY
jgi:hypothetical protein